MNKLKKIPKFRSSSAEADFWSANDSTKFIDWSQASRAAFPRLKPSTKTISLRLPDDLLNELKILANKEDVPYQSLMKIILARGVHSFRK